MASTTLAVCCQCGTVSGELHDAVRCTRTVCYCDDCQAFARRLRPGILDEHGGTDLLQVSPCQLHIAAGSDQIRCLRLKEGGLYRWYTECCRTPVGNTAPQAWVPFVGLPTAFVPEARGSTTVPKAVEFRVQLGFAQGTPPRDGDVHLGKGSRAYFWRLTKHVVLGRIRGEQQPSPFFGRDGKAVVREDTPTLGETA